MTYVRITPFFWILNIISLILLLAIVTAPPHLAAADLQGELSADSKIELGEIAGGGAYQRRTITMSSLQGAITLSVKKDADTKQFTMAQADYYDLWQYLLAEGIDHMGNAVPEEGTLPDLSTFILECRAGTSSYGFTAEGVDFLSDTRYRDIIRKIIEVAKKYEQ